jgi:hypothetical protein
MTVNQIEYPIAVQIKASADKISQLCAGRVWAAARVESTIDRQVGSRAGNERNG